MYEQHANADRVSRARRTLVAGLVALIGFALITVARPPTASADVPYPYTFMPSIDPYAAYQGQSTCDPTAKPGVLGFRDLLNFWFGSHGSGIVRACSVGDRSEHKEGRALDYSVNARTDPATTLKILAWVLGADQYGNQHAFGRRFGLMYIVSNGRIFGFYNASAGWRPYDPGPNEPTCVPNDSRETVCHVDHIHFSFSWAGARKQTSWWTTTQWARTANSCSASGMRVDWWFFPSNGFGPLIQIKRLRTPGGPTYDTQSEIRNSPWRIEAGGHTYLANQPVSALASPRPRAKLPAFVTGGWCYVNLT